MLVSSVKWEMYTADWQQKKQDHLISYIYFYKEAFIFILVLFACFAEAVHCGWCQDLFSSQDFAAFSSTFLLPDRFSSPAGESVGSGDILAAVQPSEACANWRGQVPLKKEQSPALFPHVICLHCQKCWFLQSLLSWECFADLGICLLSSVVLSRHLQLPPSALKSVLLSCLALSSFPNTTLSVKSSETAYRKLSNSVLLEMIISSLVS